MSNDKIKIAIADDHQIVIDGISSILEVNEEIEVVDFALCGEDALKLISELAVDVLLLDINMPGVDGIEVARRLKEMNSPVEILVLTMYNEPQFTKQLIELGVKGCVNKNADKKEVIQAIRTVHSGERYYGADVTNKLFDSIDKSKKAAQRAQLTKREVEVLKLIAQGNSTGEIAEELCISTHTVETHRKNLLSKLGMRNAAELARYATKNHLDE